MIPGEHFSYKKLNIGLPYQQLIKAARKGDKEAKIQVALLYMHGVGVTRDFDKAEYWFQQSARDNHPQGQKMLAYTYYGSQNQKAFRYFKKSALQGDMEAQYWTSRLYYRGEGVNMSKSKAEYWNKKAVAQDMQSIWTK
nr:tetratricopeptide repeat protein [Shewanella electrodiphila]